MRYRILISDDEVDIVEMLTGFFRSKGYEVFSAYNGVETLKLAELQPDIILLDINMPKLDGMEVCKKIRDYVSCPILFLTARIEENDKVQGFSVGGDDYIVKPFSLVELEARVQAHLRREERHQTNTKVKFSGELLIDYSERTVYIQNQARIFIESTKSSALIRYLALANMRSWRCSRPSPIPSRASSIITSPVRSRWRTLMIISPNARHFLFMTPA